jgi:hypothetical protein
MSEAWRFLVERALCCYRSAIKPGPTTPNQEQLVSLYLVRRWSWLFVVALPPLLERIHYQQVAGSIPVGLVPNRCKPGELRQPTSRAFPRSLLGKIIGGLRSLLLTVTSDLRVGGSNPSGRATLARVSEDRAGTGKRLVATWSPADPGIERNRADARCFEKNESPSRTPALSLYRSMLALTASSEAPGGMVCSVLMPALISRASSAPAPAAREFPDRLPLLLRWLCEV